MPYNPHSVLAGLHNPIVLSSNPIRPNVPTSYPVDRPLAALRTGSVISYQPSTYTIVIVLVTLLIAVPRHNRLATVPTLVAGPLAYTLVATVFTLVTGLMAVPVGPALVTTAGNQLAATGPKRGMKATRPLQLGQ